MRNEIQNAVPEFVEVGTVGITVCEHFAKSVHFSLFIYEFTLQAISISREATRRILSMIRGIWRGHLKLKGKKLIERNIAPKRASATPRIAYELAFVH